MISLIYILISSAVQGAAFAVLWHIGMRWLRQPVPWKASILAGFLYFALMSIFTYFDLFRFTGL